MRYFRFFWLLLFSPALGFGQSQGLSLSLQSIPAKDTDTQVAQNISLYVPEGQSPSPFLAPGKFQATWTGSITVDLRGDYNFQADLNGTLKLEISNTIVLELTGTNTTTALTKPIRLTKGLNQIHATYTSPASGDAYVRVFWKPVDNPIQPLPFAALRYTDSPELQKATTLHTGRDLFIEHRCIKCHTTESASAEFAVDAPSFEDLAARRNPAWIARWIADPKSLRPSARMPKIFHGPTAKENAQAIALFFASLSSNAPNATFTQSPQLGKALFETLHCDACHIAPDATESDPQKISLQHVAEKFSPASLIAFLKQPNEHYPWIRMPRFRLTDDQRAQLAAFLFTAKVTTDSLPGPTDALIEHGKTLIQSSGCLNCHAFSFRNKFPAKPLIQLKNLQAGCLSDSPEFDYALAPWAREALRAWLSTARASITRFVPAEFAAHQSRNLNCLNCHGPVDNIPPFEILGAKLRPEWAAKFIAGEITDKPRPWLEAQMPAFPQYATFLAHGLAMQNGLPPLTTLAPIVDKDLAATGQKLTSGVPVGFGCIQCHAIGSTTALQAFEAPGINLALAGARLQHSYFNLWVRRPSVIDPNTKMPGFFDDEGKSPLTQFYNGDGPKQIEAIWQSLQP